MQVHKYYSKYQNICIAIICIWLTTPFFSYSDSARVTALAAASLWLIFEMNKPNGVISKPTMPVMLMLLFVIYTLIVEAVNAGLDGINRNIQLYIMLFFIAIQQSRRKNPESLNFLFWIAIALSAIWMTWTYIFLTTVDSRAMRTLVRSTEEARELYSKGVGGYPMAYTAVLMLPALLGLSFHPKKIALLNPPKIPLTPKFLPVLLVWYLSALSITIVISSQFSLAILGAVLGAICTLTLWRISASRIFMAILLIVACVFFGEAFLLSFLEALKPITEGTNYLLKINDLIASINTDTSIGVIDTRAERYLRSLELFFQNPILGVLAYDDLGKHSTLLDNFAQWGVIFGAILFYLVSFLCLRDIRLAHAKNGVFGVSLGTLVAILVVFGLNKHFSSAGIVLFLIYPTISKALSNPKL